MNLIFPASSSQLLLGHLLVFIQLIKASVLQRLEEGLLLHLVARLLQFLLLTCFDRLRHDPELLCLHIDVVLNAL